MSQIVRMCIEQTKKRMTFLFSGTTVRSKMEDAVPEKHSNLVESASISKFISRFSGTFSSYFGNLK